jgi:hypothetical protein
MDSLARSLPQKVKEVVDATPGKVQGW